MAKETAAAKKERLAAESANVAKVMTDQEIAASVEPSAELVLVSKDYGLKIANATVDKHVLGFSPFMVQLLALEDRYNAINFDEPSDEDAELAKVLQDDYRAIRKAAEGKKKTDKAEILEEGRLLDALEKKIVGAADAREEKLEAVKKAKEIRENARLTALNDARSAALEALDYETDFLDLKTMPEESYQKLLKKAQDAKLGADALTQQRQQESEKQAAKQSLYESRVSLLANIKAPLPAELMDLSDELFTAHYEPLKKAYDLEQADAADKVRLANEAADRIKNRINAVTALGLAYNTANESYEGYGHRITLKQVQELESQDFTDAFEDMKVKVTAKKAEDKKKADADKKEADDLRKKNEELEAAETKRKADLKKELDDKAEEERKAAAAPDQAKFKAFYLKFKALANEFPELTSPAGKIAGERFKQAVVITLAVAKEEALKLV